MKIEGIETTLSAFIADSLQEYLTQLLCSYLLGEHLTSELVIQTRASTYIFKAARKVTKLDIRCAAYYIAMMKRYGARELNVSFPANPKGADRLHLDIVKGIKLWKKHHREEVVNEPV
jgi:hypothetical protein